MLYSNIYRTRFIEFLKIDFPKIIFVDSVEIFEKLSRLGTSIINAHLLKDNLEIDRSIGEHTIKINQNKNKVIEKILYKEDTKELYYNPTCCFNNVSKEVYEYEIGSYQIIKNYLKYRKGKKLNIDEIEHLEKVIKVIHFTIKVQKEIDKIISTLKEFNE